MGQTGDPVAGLHGSGGVEDRGCEALGGCLCRFDGAFGAFAFGLEISSQEFAAFAGTLDAVLLFTGCGIELLSVPATRFGDFSDG